MDEAIELVSIQAQCVDSYRCLWRVYGGRVVQAWEPKDSLQKSVSNDVLKLYLPPGYDSLDDLPEATAPATPVGTSQPVGERVQLEIEACLAYDEIPAPMVLCKWKGKSIAESGWVSMMGLSDFAPLVLDIHEGQKYWKGGQHLPGIELDVENSAPTGFLRVLPSHMTPESPLPPQREPPLVVPRQSPTIPRLHQQQQPPKAKTRPPIPAKQPAKKDLVREILENASSDALPVPKQKSRVEIAASEPAIAPPGPTLQPTNTRPPPATSPPVPEAIPPQAVRSNTVPAQAPAPALPVPHPEPTRTIELPRMQDLTEMNAEELLSLRRQQASEYHKKIRQVAAERFGSTTVKDFHPTAQLQSRALPHPVALSSPPALPGSLQTVSVAEVPQTEPAPQPTGRNLTPQKHTYAEAQATQGVTHLRSDPPSVQPRQSDPQSHSRQSSQSRVKAPAIPARQPPPVPQTQQYAEGGTGHPTVSSSSEVAQRKETSREEHKLNPPPNPMTSRPPNPDLIPSPRNSSPVSSKAADGRSQTGEMSDVNETPRKSQDEGKRSPMGEIGKLTAVWRPYEKSCLNLRRQILALLRRPAATTVFCYCRQSGDVPLAVEPPNRLFLEKFSTAPETLQCTFCKEPAHRDCSSRFAEWDFSLHSLKYKYSWVSQWLTPDSVKKWADNFVCLPCQVGLMDPFWEVQSIHHIGWLAPEHVRDWESGNLVRLPGPPAGAKLYSIVIPKFRLEQNHTVQLRGFRLKLDHTHYPKFPNNLIRVHFQYGAHECREELSKPALLKQRQDHCLTLPDTIIYAMRITPGQNLHITLETHFETAYDGPYIISVVTAAQIEPADLLTRIKSTAVVSVMSCIDLVRNCFFPDGFVAAPPTPGEEDLLVVDLPRQIKLTCPTTMLRMTTPARGTLCKHPQCFDLTFFIESQKATHETSRWRCPVCGLSCKPFELILDPWMLRILKATPQKHRTVTIVMDKAGGINWKIVADDKVPEFDDDDDENGEAGGGGDAGIIDIDSEGTD